ncbi:hypothetical protein GGR53DRAFT_79418 [Hypoxylon sp. FL1150]|nr:hypothetical protein GGR53DRAFT_79418 [Hypoxylon sp. FL1150]
MQFKAITTLFALAAVAIAAPASDVVARNDGGSTCSNSQQAQVCCLSTLNCLVQILSATCTGQAYCCDTSAGVGSLVNIQALDCVEL